MSIQIIDNFELNSAKPIDNRFVVGTGLFYTDKSQITNLYNGLRIWDLTVGAYGLPYVWDGTAWQSENSVSMSGGGTINYVPRFNTTSSIVDSIIQDDGTGVGIGTAPSASYKLDVSGSVRSQGLGFYGNGSNITNINATNISTGNLAKERLPNGTTGYILVASIGGGGVYTNPFALTVGSASSLVTSRTLWGRAFNGTANVSGNIFGAGYIEFGTFANKAILSYGSNFTLALNVPAQTAMLSVRTLALLEQAQNFTAINNFNAITKFANGTSVAPGISFVAASTTGIYLASGNIGISIAGSDKMIIEANAINFGPWGNYYPRVRVGISSSALLPSYTWFGNDNTGIFRPSQDVVGISTNGVERMRVSNSGMSFGNGTPISTMYVMHAEVKRNGAAPVSVSGADKNGSAVTYTHVTYTANQNIVFRLNFPTAMPNTNYYCVAVADNNNAIGNDYRFQCLVTSKTTSYVQVVVVQADARWHSTDTWDNNDPVGVTVIAIAI
jgi:hypothetical protein